MDGIVNKLFVLLFKRNLPMKIRLLIRIINGVAIVFIYKKAGLDWVIVYSLIVLVSDIDSIAEKLEKKKENENDKN